ncbi:PLP-dependent aminotransferase family protein [Caldalkalibacillus mannanilyticus]|uniref:aminotransferase-like domain-containing protein n=1 Tax=Caldalkalibacillus mannanilyticus TaxID=1418 RepID=UPI0004692544|nr:PLP-dependent aminotransferase family protein [Caldalkalibacillus mannanilyticus]
MPYSFAKRSRNITSSAVRDILKIIDKGNIISFAGGLPSEDFFPVEVIKESFDKAFLSGAKSLQYGLTEGYIPLREQIVARLERKKKIYTHVDNLLITTGSQQAIDLFARTMLDAGDVVLTENPTYLAANQVFGSYEARIIPVLSDENGMFPEDLEQKIKQYQPKCIYVVPTFSNPVGKVWSEARRKAVLEVAQRHHIVILEDDPYGEIQFTDEQIYPIAAYDTEGSTVLYTSTFSKTVAPAVRTGWITGPLEIIKMMAQFKQAAVLHSNSLSQHALYFLLRDFELDQHIQVIRDEYQQRMQIMNQLLLEADIEDLRFATPQGGMFFWLELHPSINTTDLLAIAVQKGVAFVPGAPFYVNDPEQHTLRLNFSHSTPEKIKEGIHILTEVLKEEMAVKR